jgi:hypothetical protein
MKTLLKDRISYQCASRVFHCHQYFVHQRQPLFGFLVGQFFLQQEAEENLSRYAVALQDFLGELVLRVRVWHP